MGADAGSTISTYFRVCDGVRVRFADTKADSDVTLLLLAPWPESLWAFRRIWAAGRGRDGALGAEKPLRLCEPSQNGLMPDLPQRHRAIVCRPGSMSPPSWSTSRKLPRTISGPSR